MKLYFNLQKSWYSKVFEVADYESEVTIFNNKMADNNL